MAYPYAFLPYVEQRFFKVDPDTGAIVPNAEGTIASFLAAVKGPGRPV